MVEVKAITYEEARTNFYKAEMGYAENRMKFWQTKIKKAKDAIQEMEAHDNASNAGWEYRFYKDALEALETQPKWISVEERLPDEPGEVLAVFLGMVTLMWSNPGGEFVAPNGMRWGKEEGMVTHWMPLPKPPKEADDDRTLEKEH